MSSRKRHLVAALVALVGGLGLGACNPQSAPPSPPTVAIVAPTATPVATATTIPPTVTIAPSPTSPPPTSPPGCRDALAFVEDVTIPDGASVPAGVRFTKTWRVRNTGDCTWAGYELAFLNGEQLGAPDAVAIPATTPGQTVDLTAPMTAPGTPGRYTGRWRLRDAAGRAFGANLTVVVQVVAATPTVGPPPRADLAAAAIWGNADTGYKLGLWVQNNGPDDVANRTVEIILTLSYGTQNQVFSPTYLPIIKTLTVPAGEQRLIRIDEGPTVDRSQYWYELSISVQPRADDADSYVETNPANNTRYEKWAAPPP